MKGDSLKDVPYYITEDQTEMDMKKRNDLQPIIEQAKRDVIIKAQPIIPMNVKISVNISLLV